MSEQADIKKKDAQATEQKTIFVSLRWKVLIGFTVIFTVVYFLALAVFTDMAVQAAERQIQADLTQTMEGIATNVDVDQVLALAETGEINADGFSDDLRFWELLEFLDQFHQAEPDAWPYLYIPSDVENQIIAIADLWTLEQYDPGNSFSFLEAYTSNSGFIVKGLSEQTYRAVDHRFVENMKNYADTIADRQPKLAGNLESFGDWLTDVGLFGKREFGAYGDEFGRWASGYMPIVNQAGDSVAAIGVDFEADIVNDVLEAVRLQVRNIFLIAYPLLLILVAVATDLLTKPLRSLTSAAERVGEGDYDVDFTTITKGRVQDEIDLLAGVFGVMVEKVRKREQTLKRKVAQLQIEIDGTKQKEEVSEITDSEFFRDLQSRASTLRKKRATGTDSEK